MKKNITKLLIIILTSFLLCGCWNYNELNELAIASSLGIDKVGEKYKVSIMISNAKSAQISSKEGQSQTTVIEGTGETLTDALDDIDLKSPKQIYLNHLTSIVISEKVAKEGVNKIVDFLLRDPESRKRFYLLVTKDEDAKDVLKILSPLEAITSQNIASNIMISSKEQALTTTITYSNFINVIMQPGINPVLTSISIDGKESKGKKNTNLEQSSPDAMIKLGPLGIFKQDKLLGFANVKESEGINLVLNNVSKMSVKTKCENNYIVASLKNTTSTINVTLKDNKPIVSFNIKGLGSISEFNCSVNLMSPKVIEKIDKDIEGEVKKIIKAAITLNQKKYKTDVFGIGLKYYHYYPEYYHKVRKRWDADIFPNIPIKVNVKLDIDTKGSLEQTIRKEYD